MGINVMDTTFVHGLDDIVAIWTRPFYNKYTLNSNLFVLKNHNDTYIFFLS